MGIPNVITSIRLIIGPIFWILYNYYEVFGIPHVLLPAVLLMVVGVAELSDLLDGWIARHYDQVSDLGKIFDPMADSVARLSYFLTFAGGPIQLPMLFIMFLFYRDAMVSTLRTICALRGFALAARWTGKLKAVLQAIATVVILLTYQLYLLDICTLSSLRTVGVTAIAIATGYSVLSGIDYFIANRQYIRQVLRKKPGDAHATAKS